jgi:kynurenine aminotransferase
MDTDCFPYALQVAHTRIVFCCNSAASEAAGIGLSLASKSDFFAQQLQEYDERRERLCKIFQDLGMTYHWPSGSYFVMVDMSSIQIPDDFEYGPQIQNRDKSYKMAWFVAKTVDVVGIPATAFASDEGAKHFEKYVRFSFCKTEKEFAAAAERLQNLEPYIKA